MSTKKRIVYLGIPGLAAVILFLLLSRLDHSGSSNLRAAELVTEMVAAEDCISPCYFGTSLRGATYEEARTVLQTSPLTDQSQLITEQVPGGQEIKWLWPDDIAERLTSQKTWLDRKDHYFYASEYNYVTIRDGFVQEVRLTFAVQLDRLMDELGPPEAAFPDTLLGFGNMIVSLAYEEPLGYFEIRTRCQPEISPNQTVHAYYYSESIRANLFDTQSPFISHWSGYNTQVSDCATSFLPE